MRRAFTVLLVAWVFAPSVGFAAEETRAPVALSGRRNTAPPVLTTPLGDALAREARRRSGAPSAWASPLQRPPSQHRGWIKRHPVLFTALVGAGVGAVSSVPRWTELYCVGGGDEDCLFHGFPGLLFGAGAGAGIGALAGLLVVE